MNNENVSSRMIAAVVEKYTRKDPIVRYADSDAANKWIDVEGKVDTLSKPLEDLDHAVCTIHPTVSDHGERVTRVWYRHVDNSVTDDK